MQNVERQTPKAKSVDVESMHRAHNHPYRVCPAAYNERRSIRPRMKRVSKEGILVDLMAGPNLTI